MIISNASISLQQQSSSERSDTVYFNITERNNQPNRLNLPASEQVSVRPTISTTALHAPHKEQYVLNDDMLNAQHELRMQLIIKMVEAFTGKEFKLFSPMQLQSNNTVEGEVDLTSPSSANPSPVNANQTTPTATRTIEYNYYASHYEYDSVSFTAEGTIQTQDGKTINFSSQLNLQRELFEQVAFQFTSVETAKIDPLVLNFNGTSAQLQQTRFEFDLDADGQTEQIALLAPGNAYLALDKNNDGIINDGSELFGPSTNNGFAELAQYDEDGNNFIDEADSIYSQLRLWSSDEHGQQQLIGLGQQGVGAIYLGHLNTPFELQDNDQALGNLVSSSIYINEDGSTGFIQQIDLLA